MSLKPWDEIATLARFAPTPHNTQPFRIRPLSARVAQIVVLRERMLPVEDTDNLYVLSSLGIFAETLERAARHFGVHLRVTPEAGVVPAAIGPGVGPVVLGRAEVLGRCAARDERTGLEARRTSRLPYEDRLVPPAILGELGRIAAGYGHRFESFDEPGVVRDVLEHNVTALLENNLKPEELAELRSWIRVADTPETGDGLWTGPLNQPRWETRLALAAPRLFLLPGIASIVRRKYLRTQAGTRHVAILRGPFGSWPELVTAGRMLMDVWLAMTRHGIYMLPYGSMITNASCNRYLRERFAANDIWFILRFGYSKVPPKAPRLASVLLGEDPLCTTRGEVVRPSGHYVPGRSAAASR
jgi:hypothetical protein